MPKKHKALVALNVIQFEIAQKKQRAADRERQIVSAEANQLAACRKRVEVATTRLAEVKVALCELLQLDPAKTSLAFVDGEPVLEEWEVPGSKGLEHAIEDQEHVEVATLSYRELRDAKTALKEAEERKAERDARPTTAVAELHAYLLPIVQKAHPEAPASCAITLHVEDRRLSVTWTEGA